MKMGVGLHLTLLHPPTDHSQIVVSADLVLFLQNWGGGRKGGEWGRHKGGGGGC